MNKNNVKDEPSGGEASKSQPSTSTCPSTPPKKRKRLCVFNKAWLEVKEYAAWLKEGKHINEARCTMCNNYFAIGSMGISSVKQHMESEGHKKRSQSAKSSRVMETFFAKKDTKEEGMVISSELVQVFHAVKHHISYNSTDCQIKLNSKIFTDSKIAQKLSCGRTKSEAYVTNILGPFSIENVLFALKDVFFSIQIDASNRKNRKLFPICIQYFSKSEGLTNKIIDFYENPDESANGMFEAVQKSLGQLGLSLLKVSSLNADNTNANFGKNHSLYTNLQSANPNILKANCHAHILHNCFKHSLGNLDLDVENLVLKIYAHFSQSAKRREELQDFCLFVESTYKELLRHVVTRWLSMGPCIERLLVNWQGLCSYFLSAQEACSKQLKNILNIFPDSIEVPLKIEIYLLFIHNICELFEKTIKKIESNKTTACEIFQIMTDFKNQLETRKNEKFFGYETGKKLKNENVFARDRELMIKDFLGFLDGAIHYLNKWFNFNKDNWLYIISNLSLKEKCPGFNDLVQIIEKCNLKDQLNVNMDLLFEEMISLKENFDLIKRNEHFPKSCSSDKWHFIFKNINNCDFSNLFKIISFFMSIPASSAFPERVFSVVNFKWSDERNRCSIDLIKNELYIYFNINENCAQFFDSVKNNTSLLQKAKTQEKYKFKKVL